MIEQLHIWLNAHSWSVGIAMWFLGWFMPSPWIYFFDHLDDIIIKMIVWSKNRLKKEGATDAEIKLWESRFHQIVEEVDKKLEEDLGVK
jgi:hypothetical protein